MSNINPKQFNGKNPRHEEKEDWEKYQGKDRRFCYKNVKETTSIYKPME